MRATLFLFGTSWTLSASWWAFFVAMALATGGALASDPRFAGVDWADARNRLRAYVWKRVGKTLEVDDIVQSAILKALEPGARVWDRAKQSFFLYLGSYANSVMWGQLVAAHRRRCGSGLTPAVLATLRADGADPHETLTRQADRSRGVFRLEELKARLKGDGLAELLLALYEEGTPGPDESTRRAMAAGYSREDLRVARRKIQREVREILERDALADLTALQEKAR